MTGYIQAKKVKICETALLIALCAALCAGTWAQARQEALSAALVRLHVVAVSDDACEQEIKLDVRDAVLEYLTPKLDGVQDVAQARRIIAQELNAIAQIAAANAQGRGITVTLGQERYPTRRYTGFALPAGEYESLRIVLGEGAGENWWCVVFPPLCTGGVEADEVRAAMKSDDYAIITESGEYELKFRTLELWGELTAMFER